MIFLSPKEIEEGVKALSSILDLNVDSQNGDVIADHMNDLSSIGANASLIYGSSKYHYLKDKKNSEAAAMYSYTEALIKTLHYKISSCQSLLRRETQIQFSNNKHI